MQRLIEPSVTPDGQKAPGLKFGQPRVMALFLARLHQRVFRPGLAAAIEPPCKVEVPHPLRDKLRESFLGGDSFDSNSLKIPRVSRMALCHILA